MSQRWISTTICVLLLPLLLSSCLLERLLGCEKYMTTVTFPDHPDIVQGSWHGTLNRYPAEGAATELRIELDARYLDEKEYAVSGTFRLGDEEERALEGTVSGNCFERYVQFSRSAAPVNTSEVEDVLGPSSIPPPASLSAEVRSADGTLLWTLWADLGGFTGQPLEQGLRGHLENAEGAYHNFELERLP